MAKIIHQIHLHGPKKKKSAKMDGQVIETWTFRNEVWITNLEPASRHAKRTLYH
jgi:hypothetical protein